MEYAVTARLSVRGHSSACPPPSYPRLGHSPEDSWPTESSREDSTCPGSCSDAVRTISLLTQFDVTSCRFWQRPERSFLEKRRNSLPSDKLHCGNTVEDAERAGPRKAHHGVVVHRGQTPQVAGARRQECEATVLWGHVTEIVGARVQHPEPFPVESRRVGRCLSAGMPWTTRLLGGGVNTPEDGLAPTIHQDPPVVNNQETAEASLRARSGEAREPSPCPRYLLRRGVGANRTGDGGYRRDTHERPERVSWYHLPIGSTLTTASYSLIVSPARHCRSVPT